MQSGTGTEIIDVRNGDWAAAEPMKRRKISFIRTASSISCGTRSTRASGPNFDVYLRPEGKRKSNWPICLDSGAIAQRLDTIAMWMDGSFADTKVIIDNILVAGPRR